jgi:DNA-binding CsgD family transcriptional regulator
MSERQFYRIQKQAIELFGLRFWQMEETCNRDSDPADKADVRYRPGRRARYVTTPLSPIETRILELVSQGLTSREIASSLSYSSSYVQHTLERIHEKLGAKNTAHAVAIALHEGFITLSES